MYTIYVDNDIAMVTKSRNLIETNFEFLNDWLL